MTDKRQLQVVLSGAGDSFKFTIVWRDENHGLHHVDIDAELMNQDVPRLLGVRVSGRPVLLMSSDTVFHAAAPLDVPKGAEIV